MSDERRPNWAEMKREDFEAPPRPRPAPPGQMELFEPGPGRARAKPRHPEECPIGTMSLLDLLQPER
ncbi:hypothetical protein [Streptomyces sp. CC210A]|uniref:hypothetical protein n=1 Tax=Streptomyces sp. CC210A TaxID=2898184 RepID=UPI001F1B1302|nr:hypothetical protein [Streptomyces sp. CC210A]